tara:strand:- start:850 stop:1893 length:1044 start_codon:yes stop_codon:yes gene_type:complete
MVAPTINIAPFFYGNNLDKRNVADQLNLACRETGFFAISGHGVDEKIIKNTRAEVVKFFALSIEEKLKVERPPEKVSRGYNRFKDRSLSYSIGKKSPPDLQEAFAFGPNEFNGKDWVKDDPSTAMLAPNRWPKNPPNFRKTLIEYDSAMRWLGDRMLDIISVSLDIDRSYFSKKFDHQSSVGRVIRYPAEINPAEPGQLRAGEHTDYGTVTFLRGDPVPGGTEVKTSGGEWVEVTCPPGGFVCNIGDALSRWTNGHWKSTLHRVGNPPTGAPKIDRISLVYFHSPNHDALIECVPSCIGDGPKFKPVTFSEHYLDKVMKAAHARLNAKAKDATKQNLNKRMSISGAS